MSRCIDETSGAEVWFRDFGGVESFGQWTVCCLDVGDRNRRGWETVGAVVLQKEVYPRHFRRRLQAFDEAGVVAPFVLGKMMKNSLGGCPGCERVVKEMIDSMRVEGRYCA
jgi:hypothetical protein